jgi:uncharacterized protein (TIGR02217 family)
MPFIEELLPGCMDYGSTNGQGYAVEVVVDASDNTYTRMRHPYPVRRFECGFGNESYDFMLKELVDMFNRVGGMFGGFRFYDRQEFSTNNYVETPTFSDQQAVAVDILVGTYQITRWYGSPSDPLATRRRIRKPRAGSVVAGIRDFAGFIHQITDFTVSTTTGIITLGSKSGAVTGITQAAQAVVTVGSGHPFVIGDSVVFGNVGGMTQINGLRASVVAADATTITVGINSTGFSAFTSGGDVATIALFTETVFAGCYFDIPVRFETDLTGVTYSNLNMLSTVVSLVEILNPDPQ